LTAPLFLRCCLGEKWTFFDNVDVWRESLMGTFEERIGRLTDPVRRQQMKEIYDKSKQPRSVGDIYHFICRKIQNEDLRAKYQDRTAGDIAKVEGRHIIDVVIDISAADVCLPVSFGFRPSARKISVAARSPRIVA